VIERYHMAAINGVPEVIRTIVVDVDEERARRVALRHGFPLSSKNLRDLADNADLAIVAVPNGQHAQVACDLLSKGIHVLCEKPMARNVDECRSMIESSRLTGALLCIGHNRRCRSHIAVARRMLRRGLIGEVTRVEAEEGSPHDWPRSPAYFDPILSGGGALLDVGIHSIDLIRSLLDEFEDVEYQGNGTEKSVESDAELRFRLSTGTVGILRASRMQLYQQKLTLTGNDGFLEIGLWDQSLGIRNARGKAFQYFERLDLAVPRRPPNDSSFVEQLRNFVSAIKGETKLLVDGEEGMAAVEVVCKAYRSMSSLSAQPAVAFRDRK
jgi:predicted dehydrogenase